MKLVIGLGNPTAEYSRTRHNAGFMVIDRLAQQHGLDNGRSRFESEAIEGRIGEQKVMLLKPQTYMNRSGSAVGAAARFYKLQPADVLVAVDDLALPVGHLRLRAGGSAGGHNGLTDIQQHLGTDRFPRLRVGIGAPMINDRKIPQADYVLSAFTPEQLEDLEPALGRAAQAVECWLAEGTESAMNRFNSKAPGEPGG